MFLAGRMRHRAVRVERDSDHLRGIDRGKDAYAGDVLCETFHSWFVPQHNRSIGPITGGGPDRGRDGQRLRRNDESDLDLIAADHHSVDQLLNDHAPGRV